MPPRKNIGKTVKAIISQGPKLQPQATLAKGKAQSFVQHVQRARTPTPPQNQRGRVLNKDSRDLTR